MAPNTDSDRFSLSYRQQAILAMFRPPYGANCTDLAEHYNVDYKTIYNAVRTLVKHGLLEETEPPPQFSIDHRKKFYIQTKPVQALYSSASPSDFDRNGILRVTPETLGMFQVAENSKRSKVKVSMPILAGSPERVPLEQVMDRVFNNHEVISKLFQAVAGALAHTVLLDALPPDLRGKPSKDEVRAFLAAVGELLSEYSSMIYEILEISAWKSYKENAESFIPQKWVDQFGDGDIEKFLENDIFKDRRLRETIRGMSSFAEIYGKLPKDELLEKSDDKYYDAVESGIVDVKARLEQMAAAFYKLVPEDTLKTVTNYESTLKQRTLPENLKREVPLPQQLPELDTFDNRDKTDAAVLEKKLYNDLPEVDSLDFEL